MCVYWFVCVCVCVCVIGSYRVFFSSPSFSWCISLSLSRGFPLFDERFRGYGFDKNSHMFFLAVRAFEYWVLPDVFAIHVNHPVTNWGGALAGNHEQQWDALALLCRFFIEVRAAFGFASDERVGSASPGRTLMFGWCAL
jgi:Glycosyl-transferase for dystroglycan